MVLSPQSFLVVLLACIASARAGQAEAVEDECQVLLLQTSAGLQRQSIVPSLAEDVQAAQAAQAARLEASLPLVYMHVPKTGSSIANAFIRLPGVCTDFVEELGDDSFHNHSSYTTLRRIDSFISTQFIDFFLNRSLCEGIASPSTRANYCFGCHNNVGNDAMFSEYYDGHGVTMLRQPEQRVMSGLRHVADSLEVPIESLHFSEGCTARMLSGDNPNWSGSATEVACFAHGPNQALPPALPAADVAKAVARLRSFAFVGIQEEWHLSVCLLHAMFGGECHTTEFLNTRPSGLSGQPAADLRQGSFEQVFAAPEPYDTSILGGWVDTADRAVYDAGLEMFHSLCEDHGVTAESCRPCFETAGLL